MKSLFSTKARCISASSQGISSLYRKDQLDALKELHINPSLFPMHTFYWDNTIGVLETIKEGKTLYSIH